MQLHYDNMIEFINFYIVAISIALHLFVFNLFGLNTFGFNVFD